MLSALVDKRDLTQTVISHSIGHHHIMGFTIDDDLQDVISAFEIEIIISLKQIENLKEAVRNFTSKFNGIMIKNGKKGNTINPSHFDKLMGSPETWPKDGKLLEIMARYGDPTIISMPSVLQYDLSCDMSFSGIKSFGIDRVSVF